MEYIYTKHVLFNLKCIFSEVVYFYLLTPETLTTVNVASGWAVWDPRQDLTEECSSTVFLTGACRGEGSEARSCSDWGCSAFVPDNLKISQMSKISQKSGNPLSEPPSLLPSPVSSGNISCHARIETASYAACEG